MEFFLSFSSNLKAIIYLLFAWKASGFNVDTNSPYFYKNPAGTKAYFGYTVALHSDGTTKSLLVGAPLANVSAQFGEHLESYGALYACRTSAPGSSCVNLQVDKTKESTNRLSDNSPEFKLEHKSGQWLGGSLDSTDGKVVVCAPRYIWSGTPNVKGEQYWQVQGRCFVLGPDLTGRTSLRPCAKNAPKKRCQAGLSAQIKENNDVVMGAVGSNDYMGNVILQSATDQTELKFSTQDQIKIYAYMGYSVAYGHISTKSNLEYIAGGPRGDDIMGKVIVYKNIGIDLQVASHLPRPKNLKFASYFGSVICAVDLNNDGYTDVLVGAPQYTDKGDEGRVFVYINKKGVVDYEESMTLSGDNRKGARFGSAIAAVGDLNKDGFQDVAIGSPYDGPDGKGAVYIYHGTQEGIRIKYKQRILASEISKKVNESVVTFGQSITGGIDIDGNKYSDIAVGAFGSDNAFLLRTRRIIDVEARVTLSTTEIVLENNDTLCMEPISKQYQKCINLTLELKFEDKEASNPKGLKIAYEISLDNEQALRSDQLRRIYFIEANERSFSLKKECTLPRQREWGCQFKTTVYLRDKSQVVDKLSSLTFHVSFDLVAESCTLCPVQNDYKPRVIKKEVPFLKECAGQICQPNLEVKSDFVLQSGLRALRIGAADELTIEVNVTNLANDAAYRSQVFITYPKAITYIGARLEDRGVQCSHEQPTNGTGVVTCEIGNPLKAKAKRNFGIRFSTEDVHGNVNKLTVYVKAKSASKDVDGKDNNAELKIPVKFDADLAISGTSDKKEIIYKPDSSRNIDYRPKNQDEIGPLVVQTVTVINNGPSTVEEFNVDVNMVSLYRKDRRYSYLLYLLHVEVDGSAGTCQVQPNPLNIPKMNTTGSNINERKRRDTSSSTILNCNKLDNCTRFTCRFGKLLNGNRAIIKVTSRVWINTFHAENPGNVILETIAEVKPPLKVTQSNTKNDIAVIKLKVRLQGAKVKRKTPVWVYILAALGGILLLALLVFLLFRVGFFKRKKIKNISNPDEAQPMAPAPGPEAEK